MIENIMTFIAIPLTLWLERRKAFSTLSAVMIFLLLLLHSMGAHYTYSEMPGFESLSQFFGFERNHYDRFVHFMFGFLIFLPLTEVFSKNIGDKKVILALTVFIIFGVSSLYEIFEWIAAISVEPKVGFSVLGSQGDIWDAQKDMVLAHLGALLAMMFWHKRVGVLKS
ncbi:MAG: DUF2238 domain-containing protein [Thiovulaceae bacterium]|nr:DUF2238 domain-containing protein [Sulfurimonadaceae bacterium]